MRARTPVAHTKACSESLCAGKATHGRLTNYMGGHTLASAPEMNLIKAAPQRCRWLAGEAKAGANVFKLRGSHVRKAHARALTHPHPHTHTLTITPFDPDHISTPHFQIKMFIRGSKCFCRPQVYPLNSPQLPKSPCENKNKSPSPQIGSRVIYQKGKLPL